MLTNDDVVSGAKRKNSIARSAWPIELHSGEKPRLEWLLDDYYDIAYDNFVPVKGEGSWWLDVVCPPSMKRWRRRGSQLNVFPTATRSGWRPPCAWMAKGPRAP
jgi:hypothetical protein